LSRLYVLDSAAEADLREIARYTRKTWGAAQVGVYKAKLTLCMETLAKGEGLYKELPVLRAGLRAVRCQHHFIFMLSRQGLPAVVLAVFHERMDIMARLKGRL
jgi:plasmid stabilization system protein ParE